jgi:heme-degrading monooxygenase HmoA
MGVEIRKRDRRKLNVLVKKDWLNWSNLLEVCFKSIDCDPSRPLNPPILGDFETELAQKSPRIGGWGASVKRFDTFKTSSKTMILEAVVLNINPGREAEFEATFKQASALISAIEGYLSHELHRCLEKEGKYLLLVRWATLEAHTVTFRQSPEFQHWKQLLHHFYDSFPVIEHFEDVMSTALL